jgi:hypothetical protein
VSAPPRLIARVGPRTGEVRTVHTVGLPGRPQQLMPIPQLVVIEVGTDGVYLFRFTAGGADGGDTWHESVDDAKAQAAFEYDPALGEWYPVPPDVDDPVAFAVNLGLVPEPDA